ncbi:MAG TPA: hypothetical protein VFC38_12690 [Stellaceae bacterium]|nr:hypothetical protein [Stellaceae bacterium]
MSDWLSAARFPKMKKSKSNIQRLQSKYKVNAKNLSLIRLHRRSILHLRRIAGRGQHRAMERADRYLALLRRELIRAQARLSRTEREMGRLAAENVRLKAALRKPKRSRRSRPS